jgi:hypothetical protein
MALMGKWRSWACIPYMMVHSGGHEHTLYGSFPSKSNLLEKASDKAPSFT